MIRMYDHRAASVVVKGENRMGQGQTIDTSEVQYQNPEFTTESRWWIDQESVVKTHDSFPRDYFLGFKDITSPTNQRTMIAAAIPWSAVTNHFPLLLTTQRPRLELCLLANLNSFVLDYAVRQKIGGITLNFFIVEQFPIFLPEFYSERCPWDKRHALEKWISDRALKLTCASNDMIPLAQAAGFDPPVHKWKPSERAELMAELDAAHFLLYGICHEDVEYILSTFTGARKEGDNMFEVSDATSLIFKHYDRLMEKSPSS